MIMIDEEIFIKNLHRWRKALTHLAQVEAELLKQGIVPFTAEITTGNRITIPLDVMKKLKLEVNNRVLIPVYKLSQTETPSKKKGRSPKIGP